MYRSAARGVAQWPSAAVRMVVTLLFLVLGWPPLAASIEPTSADLLLMAQSLSFLDRAPAGVVDLGIVYPANSESGLAAAHRIVALFGHGVQSGDVILRPRLVTTSEALAADGPAALLLTDAALADAPAIAAALAGRGVLTITSDPMAVTAGEVVLGVRSRPRVEIFVSRVAARVAGVEFSTPFRLMIQER